MSGRDEYDPLHWMPIIVRAPDLSAADRKFCASMIAKSRHSSWRASWKEQFRMRRIADDYRNRMLRSATNE